jgi:hypothetical protein
MNYPTQKPEAFLDRIINASQKKGFSFDCFVVQAQPPPWPKNSTGAGLPATWGASPSTPPASGCWASPASGRLWCRTWASTSARPGRRPSLAADENAAAVVRQYRHFILDLYRARPSMAIPGCTGSKRGAWCMSARSIRPSPPTMSSKSPSSSARRSAPGKDAPSQAAVDVLGWDFAFELNEVARQQAAEANINMRFLRIPREVLEQKAVEQGDIRSSSWPPWGRCQGAKGREVTLQADRFRHPARRCARRCAARHLPLVAMDRLLGGRLGQPGRYLPQHVAGLPHPPGQNRSTANSHPPLRPARRVHHHGQGHRHPGQRHHQDPAVKVSSRDPPNPE